MEDKKPTEEIEDKKEKFAKPDSMAFRAKYTQYRRKKRRDRIEEGQ